MKKFWKSEKALDCASSNLGLPLKLCLRACCIVGMISSLLYVIAGTSIITHISNSNKATFSARDSSVIPYSSSERTIHIYYSRNVGFFIGVSVVLVILNLIQLFSDGLLFLFTFKNSHNHSLWVYMMLDVTLWIMSLICFITIFSGGGLFLLLVFLLGTAIRVYITFILHEYMVEESKIHDGGEPNVEAPHSQSPQNNPHAKNSDAVVPMENLNEEDENLSDSEVRDDRQTGEDLETEEKSDMACAVNDAGGNINTIKDSEPLTLSQSKSHPNTSGESPSISLEHEKRQFGQSFRQDSKVV